MKTNFLLLTAIAVVSAVSCNSKSDEILAVRMDQTKVQLVKGESVQLNAQVVPDQSADFVWYSQDESYVTVDQNGLVTAVGLKKDTESGEVKPVSVYAKYKTGAAECQVTVLPLDVERIEITFAGSSSEALVMNPGDVQEVQAVFYPENADLDLENLVWSTTAFEYAVVAQDKNDPSKAKVTALWPGSASIKAEYGKASAMLNLIVRPVNATSVTIAGPEEVQLKVGQGMQLSASFLPANATVELGWNSLDTNVASVDYETGFVTALSEGVATIKVVAGLVEDTVTVRVSAE